MGINTSNDQVIVVQALQDAFNIAGSQSALARSLKITQQSVQQWWDNAWVPPKRVLEIEEKTGISRHRLSPIIYPLDIAE